MAFSGNWVKCNQLDLEALQSLRHAAANPAEADDTDGFTKYLGTNKPLAVPLALFHR